MKLGEAKPQTRGEHARLEDIVDLVKLPNGKWIQLRILDTDVISYRQHWINIMTSKTKREVRIPKMCLAHNPLTEELSGKCPYCEVESQGGVSYLVNVIVRSLQDDEPGKIKITKAERESGFKDPSSESWTPVRVLRLTAGLMKKVQELKALNKIKGPKGVKTFDVNHDKYGVDLNIKFDEKAKGPEKYQVNLAEKTPLSEAEQNYLRYELTEEIVKQLGLETLAEAKKELSRMQIVGSEEFEVDDEDDDDTLGKKKKPGAKKPGAKKSAKYDDDDDDSDDDDDDEDDDTPPKRGSKKPAPKKPAPKRKPSDEDDDFDDEDDDEEEDAPPPKRGSKKPAPKKPTSKRKPADDDEDDDDEDEDDDFDDEDDDEEEDAPPPKRGSKKPAPKKPAPKKPTSKRKPADDDEDDDDEDEDDDFDDDDDDEDDDVPF